MGEQYVNEIDKQTESCCNKQQPLTKFRELLSLLVKSTPKIVSISDCEENGDMSFVIPLKELGMTADHFTKYNKEFFSNYIVDMLGELLIRENVHLFANHLTGLKTDYYVSAVSRSIHKRFGMKIEKGFMTFYFHISLVQDILTEDFKQS
jgi:hypothetical protein